MELMTLLTAGGCCCCCCCRCCSSYRQWAIVTVGTRSTKRSSYFSETTINGHRRREHFFLSVCLLMKFPGKAFKIDHPMHFFRKPIFRDSSEKNGTHRQNGDGRRDIPLLILEQRDLWCIFVPLFLLSRSRKSQNPGIRSRGEINQYPRFPGSIDVGSYPGNMNWEELCALYKGKLYHLVWHFQALVCLCYLYKWSHGTHSHTLYANILWLKSGPCYVVFPSTPRFYCTVFARKNRVSFSLKAFNAVKFFQYL